MRRFALIKNEVIDNIVLCDNQMLANELWPDVLAVDLALHEVTPSIGWVYRNGIFYSQEPPIIPPSQ